jgi:hypothetical protein
VNVNLHIERLILEGIDLDPAQRPILQAAVEAELSRLIAEGGVGALTAGGAVPSLRAGGFQIRAMGILGNSGGRSRGRCMGGSGNESAGGRSEPGEKRATERRLPPAEVRVRTAHRGR